MSPVPDIQTLYEFVACTIQVLHATTGIDAEFDPEGPIRTEDGRIVVVIHLRGDLAGVTWRFPEAVARAAADRMVPGVVADPEICELAAAELANILTGRAAAVLDTCGVHIELSPPEIFIDGRAGVSAKISTTHGAIDVVFHAPLVAP